VEETEQVVDLLNAEAIEYSRCAEDAVPLSYNVTASYAERGNGPVPDPQDVVAALRTWLDLQTVPRFNKTLMTRLIAADHLPMCEILSHEYDCGVPLLWLAQRVLCLPASEAHSERTVRQVRRTLGDYASRMSDDTLRRRVQMAMSQGR
jgi:hypothetical protein